MMSSNHLIENSIALLAWPRSYLAVKEIVCSVASRPNQALKQETLIILNADFIGQIPIQSTCVLYGTIGNQSVNK